MVQKLAYGIRLIGTLFGFVFFGVVGFLLNIYLHFRYARKYPHADLKTQLEARKFVSKIWGLLVKFLTWNRVIECHFHGIEKLGRPGQLILANHPTLLDIVIVFSKANTINCIVKKSLLNNYSMRGAIKACGFIPNTESEDLLDTCHQVLTEQALLIFPEGTRTGEDNLVKLHRGAVSIGLRSAKVITPVIIKASPPSLKKNQPWYHIARKTVRYDIIVADDIDPQERLKEKPLPLAARKLNKELEELFNRETQEI
ncbi:1-acyl-sn-glycerol-3-phosphate acyltransferase [Psittacicella hinzii]|uniref:1-acyl-sn-glycerol-3-phosphate acyltransferase n=1 Tax=Psittacicella hinzii TaxID=2028575 RepID=A0A3A1Y022_9GAMM|nr:lysophospholipid acyltransferase family protein [Psittacicella hinzii]RIY31642.1 1-acyl-sn-glycerol-3-phosphate acyltransferase [Psittacicella hinzii]